MPHEPDPFLKPAGGVDLTVTGRPYSTLSRSLLDVDERDVPEADFDYQPSDSEHRFTSTGIKFWKHRESLESYKQGSGRSIISTHISAEGRCNLTCDYCSVSHRTFHSTLELPRIKDYVWKLKSRGLKAVILTGGGEPTIYKHFNEMGEFILDEGLELALISNGTQWKRVSDRILQSLTWLRISMNKFDHWEKRVVVPMDRIGPQTTVGMSVCFSGDNKDVEFLQTVGQWAAHHDVAYVRVLPDCMLRQEDLLREHEGLRRLFDGMVGGEKFFHQYKIHGAPSQGTCHQSFFRPYLSEEINPDTGKPGTVFPCDSVVLNDQAKKFKHTFALCAPEQILDYLDGKIAQRFDATEHCTGCVFTRNVNMLNNYVAHGVDRFAEFQDAEVNHANFV